MLALSKEIKQIKTDILNAVPAEQIYLFGSYAQGQNNKSSDYDFYVVIPDKGLRPIEAIQSIGNSIFQHQTRPIDMLAGRKSDFASRSKLPTIEREVANTGILIYG